MCEQGQPQIGNAKLHLRLIQNLRESSGGVIAADCADDASPRVTNVPVAAVPQRSQRNNSPLAHTGGVRPAGVDPLISSSDAAITKTLQEQTRLVLAMLTPREQQVLRRRFGIGGTGKHAAGPLPQRSLTPEKVFLIETRALRKLRHPGRTMNLKTVIRS